MLFLLPFFIFIVNYKNISFANSFNCLSVKSLVGRTVCENSLLLSLDSLMEKEYIRVLKESNQSLNIIKSQKLWYGDLSICKEDIKCIKNSYIERFSQLSKIDPANQKTLSQPLVQTTQSKQVTAPNTPIYNFLATIDGNWHNPQSNYSYELIDGMGFATSTNGSNFKIGHNILQLNATSSRTFTGKQIYTDDKFYKVTVTLKSDGRLYFESEKKTKWIMERISASRNAITTSTQKTVAKSTALAGNTQVTNTGRSDQLKTQTVVVEGIGIDIQSAAQNAARNALTNVVGSFIDAQSLLNKRSEIEDGIRMQTKSITSSIKEYSQGSIQFFEIIDTKLEGSLYRVTAKVSVRIEDFRAYIQQLAEGETAVEGGLFTRSQIYNDQIRNKVDLINDLLRPLISGEVIRFDVAKPTPLLESKYKGGDLRLDSIIQKNGVGNVFLIKVNASIDPDFLQIMKRVIKETSSAQVSTFGKPGVRSNKPCGKSASTFNPNLDRMFKFSKTSRKLYNSIDRRIDSESMSEIYIIAGVADKLKKLPWGLSWKSSTSLEVAVLGDNSQVLQRERYSHAGSGGETANLMLIRHDGHPQDVPWVFATYSGTCGMGSYHARGISIVENRSYTLAIAINENALQKASKIVVRLTQ